MKVCPKCREEMNLEVLIEFSTWLNASEDGRPQYFEDEINRPLSEALKYPNKSRHVCLNCDMENKSFLIRFNNKYKQLRRKRTQKIKSLNNKKKK